MKKHKTLGFIGYCQGTKQYSLQMTINCDDDKSDRKEVVAVSFD